MEDKSFLELDELHDEAVPVDDHLDRDEEIRCGYCGNPFSSHESRIEKEILGRKWVFCSEECLQDFRDASDYKDDDPDHRIGDDSLSTSVKITGPEE